MEHCVVCGNGDEHPLVIVHDGERLAFDCFGCAIERLAPRCERCGSLVLGRGVRLGRRCFCSAHCADVAGFARFHDTEPRDPLRPAMPRS